MQINEQDWIIRKIITIRVHYANRYRLHREEHRNSHRSTIHCSSSWFRCNRSTNNCSSKLKLLRLEQFRCWENLLNQIYRIAATIMTWAAVVTAQAITTNRAQQMEDFWGIQEHTHQLCLELRINSNNISNKWLNDRTLQNKMTGVYFSLEAELLKCLEHHSQRTIQQRIIIILILIYSLLILRTIRTMKIPTIFTETKI